MKGGPRQFRVINVSSYGALAAAPPAPLLLAVLGGDTTSVYFPEWVGSQKKHKDVPTKIFSGNCELSSLRSLGVCTNVSSDPRRLCAAATASTAVPKATGVTWRYRPVKRPTAPVCRGCRS